MKVAAVLCFLLGILVSYTHFYEYDQRTDRAQIMMLAKNFITYRTAVTSYLRHTPTTGLTEVTTSDLDDYLPDNWLAMRSWKTVLQNNIAYMYGAATAREAVAVRQYAYGSQSLGHSALGNFISGSTRTPLPLNIPDGQLISVIKYGD